MADIRWISASVVLYLYFIRLRWKWKAGRFPHRSHPEALQSCSSLRIERKKTPSLFFENRLAIFLVCYKMTKDDEDWRKLTKVDERQQIILLLLPHRPLLELLQQLTHAPVRHPHVHRLMGILHPHMRAPDKLHHWSLFCFHNPGVILFNMIISA